MSKAFPQDFELTGLPPSQGTALPSMSPDATAGQNPNTSQGLGGMGNMQLSGILKGGFDPTNPQHRQRSDHNN